MLEAAKANTGAAISTTNWQSVFLASALSTVMPFVIKSSCWAVAMIDAIFVFSDFDAVSKAETVATITGKSLQCFYVALNMFSFASCFAFMVLNLEKITLLFPNVA